MKKRQNWILVINLLYCICMLQASEDFSIRRFNDRLVLEISNISESDSLFQKNLPVIDDQSYRVLSSRNCHVDLSDPMKMRDIDFCVLSVHPDQDLCSEDTVMIELEEPEVMHFDLIKPAGSFLRMYCALLPEQAELENWREIEPAQPSILFIYPENDVPQFWEAYDYLVNWKKQKGFKIFEYESHNESAEIIRDYIQNAYFNWEEPPEYVCIIGDAGGDFSIATAFLSGGEGDHFYTTLAGADQISDVHIGRLSFNSISEWQTIVYKIVMYEREPYIGDNSWFTRALLVGDPTTSGSSCVYTNINIRELIANNYPDYDFLELYEAPFMPAMQALANQGASYFNYRGFWGMSGWFDGTAQYMSNGMMLPFVVCSTCATGDFAGEGFCRSESFIRAGTTGNPRGGIGAIGTATTATHTCFNNCFVMGVAYGLFAEDLRTMGASHTRGKTGLWLNYPQNPDDASDRFSYWNNLMGDPAIEVWNQEPEEITLECEETYSVYLNSITMRVLGEYGEPKNGLYCCIYDPVIDDQYFCYSDDEGYAVFSTDDMYAGEKVITISGKQCYPVQQEFELIYGGNELDIDDFTFLDESGNGSFEPGEQGMISFAITNIFDAAVEDICVDIEAISSGLMLENSSFTIQQLQADEEVIFDETLISYQPMEQREDQKIRISITSDSCSYCDSYDVPLTIMTVSLNSYSFSDDNNNIPEAGEVIYLDFEIENAGEEALNDLSIELVSNSNLAVIQDNQIILSVLEPEETYISEDNFAIDIEEEFISGNVLILDLILTTPEGFFQEIPVIVDIGSSSANEPQGPDAHGYCIYDENDVDYMPVEYNWIEINNTNPLQLNDSGDEGDIFHVSLPFNFRFYGEEYSELTICTNGWISPGITESASFMNWIIPGEGGVSPMIAVFWDDLCTGNGGIYEQYIEEEHIYVIEWDDMNNDWDNSEETFELIIYDRDYYPSSNGNNIMKMQFKVFNNVNQGTYSGYHEGNHGQFATIGIEDQTGTIGLQYTYNNAYTETGSTLSDESAIVFGGEPVPDDSEWIVIDDHLFHNEAGEEFIEPGAETYLDIDLLNMGMIDSSLLDIELECSNAEGIELIQSTAAIMNIGSGEIEAAVFSFYVDEDFPPMEELEFNVLIESNNRQWRYGVNGKVRAPLLEMEFEDICFGDIYLDYVTEKVIAVENKGTAPLIITNIEASSENFSINPANMIIAPDSLENLHLFYSAEEPGTFFESLTIYSNSITDSIKTYEVNGNVILAPHIEIDTSTHYVEVEESEIYTYALEVQNSGEGELSCHAKLDGYYNCGRGALFSNGFLDLNQPVITVDEFTIEAWARMDGPGYHVLDTNPLYCQRNDACVTDYPKVIFFISTSSGYTRMELRSPGGIGCDVNFEAPDFGEWHHYCGTVDEDFLCLYIDGELVASEYNTESGNYHIWVNYFDIGAHTYSNTLQASFNGMMDEIRFWNRPLTIDEINANMYHSVPLDSEDLHAYWRFNEAGIWDDLINPNINAAPQLQISHEESGAMINDWSQLLNEELTLTAGQSGSFSLEIDPAWLELGEEHETSIVVSSNDPDIPEISVPFNISIVPDNAEENELPSAAALLQNYPNPFYGSNSRNSVTTIRYNIPKNCENAKIRIYNLKGQKVKTLPLQSGESSISWDGSNENDTAAGSGIYYYQLQFDGKVFCTRKLLLLR